MSLPSIPAQHLSDEAIAAYADGVLGDTACNRARRHLAECPECAYAVAVQREAMWALRSAPAPRLPSGLLDRLQALPATTPLDGPPLAIGADGSTVFATYPTAARGERPAPMTAAEPQLRAPAAATPARSVPLLHRHGALGLLTAAAVVSVGAVSAVLAGTSGGGQAQQFAPPAQHRIAPAGYQTHAAPLPLYDAPALADEFTAR